MSPLGGEPTAGIGSMMWRSLDDNGASTVADFGIVVTPLLDSASGTDARGTLRGASEEVGAVPANPSTV